MWAPGSCRLCSSHLTACRTLPGSSDGSVLGPVLQNLSWLSCFSAEDKENQPLGLCHCSSCVPHGLNRFPKPQTPIKTAVCTPSTNPPKSQLRGGSRTDHFLSFTKSMLLSAVGRHSPSSRRRKHHKHIRFFLPAS